MGDINENQWLGGFAVCQKCLTHSFVRNIKLKLEINIFNNLTLKILFQVTILKLLFQNFVKNILPLFQVALHADVTVKPEVKPVGGLSSSSLRLLGNATAEQTGDAFDHGWLW